MATPFPGTVWTITDASGAPINRAKIYTYTAGTLTAKAAYTTSALSVATSNPIITNPDGTARFYLGPGAYRIRVFDATDVPLPNYDEDNMISMDGVLSETLADATDAAKGAGMVGFGPALTHAAGTVGEHLQVVAFLKSEGCVGDGTTNDAVAFQAAADRLSTGGVLFGKRGAVYACSTAPVLKDGTILDLQGGTLKLNLNGGNLKGVTGYGRFTIRNGKIQTVSTGTPGASGAFHTCVTVGPYYGESASVGAVSPFEGSRCILENIVLTSDKDSRPVVQVVGGCHLSMRNVEILDCVASGIHLDWGSVGNVDAADVAGTRTRFDGGTAYTTHPTAELHSVIVGNLTGATSHALRLSGVHVVTATNWQVAGTSYAGFYHTAGDFGYEVAPAAMKPLRHRSISVSDFTIKDANNGWGFFIDNEADNVAAAIGGGYSPLLPVIQRINMTLTRCNTVSDAGASVIAGFRVQKVIGLRMVDCSARGHEYGILGETGSDACHVRGGEFVGNRKDGIYIHHASDVPEDWVVDGPMCYGNGVDAAYSTSAGVKTGSATRPVIRNCLLGEASEATQDNGVLLDAAGTVDAVVDGNYCYGIQSGYAYSMGAATTYTTLASFNNNNCASGITNKYTGPNIIPLERGLGADGVRRGIFRGAYAAFTAAAGVTPTAGTWAQGDVVFHSDVTGATNTGTRCSVAGTPGTWGLF